MSLSERLKYAIDKAHAAQKEWAARMKAEGWHSCSVCKKIPLPKEQKFCGQCERKRSPKP